MRWVEVVVTGLADGAIAGGPAADAATQPDGKNLAKRPPGAAGALAIRRAFASAYAVGVEASAVGLMRVADAIAIRLALAAHADRRAIRSMGIAHAVTVGRAGALSH